jgi:Ribosome recycling factor
MAYPIIESSTAKMEKTVEFFQNELNQIRTGMSIQPFH